MIYLYDCNTNKTLVNGIEYKCKYLIYYYRSRRFTPALRVCVHCMLFHCVMTGGENEIGISSCIHSYHADKRTRAYLFPKNSMRKILE